MYGPAAANTRSNARGEIDGRPIATSHEARASLASVPHRYTYGSRGEFITLHRSSKMQPDLPLAARRAAVLSGRSIAAPPGRWVFAARTTERVEYGPAYFGAVCWGAWSAPSKSRRICWISFEDSERATLRCTFPGSLASYTSRRNALPVMNTEG